MTLYFDPEGRGYGLYSEEIDLRTIGTLEINRASVIEFNHQTQLWEVFSPDRSRKLYEHASRENCLQWERRYFE